MLYPSPEYQRHLDKGSLDPTETMPRQTTEPTAPLVELPPMSPLDPIETKATFLEFRRADIIRRAMATTAGLAFIAANVGLYAADVHANQEIQANANIQIQTMSEALDPINNDKAILLLNGLGTTNADELANSSGIALQSILDSQIWPVGMNNAHLDYDAIAEAAAKKIAIEKVKTMYMIGYSTGGNIAMQVQERLRKLSDVEIALIVLDVMPDGIQTLQPARREEISLVEQFAWIPGATYSTPLRMIGETAFRADRYNSGDPIERFSNFVKTAKEVRRAINSAELPGTWLMFDQMLALQTSDIQGRFRNLDDLPDDVMLPTIVQLSGKNDYMVDNQQVGKNLVDYTDPSHIPLFEFNVPGAVHTRPDLSKKTYFEVFDFNADAIIESIDAQRALAKYNQTIMLKELAEELAKNSNPDDQIGIPNPQQLSELDDSSDEVVPTN